MDPSHNPVGWFEIPVKNMDRAIKFYEHVFGFKLQIHNLGRLHMAWFPWVEKTIGASGSLILNEHYSPSKEGVLIYFTAFSGDLSIELARVVEAGGSVLMEKKLITEEIGYMGLFLDSEGNRIALHSLK